MDGRDELRSPSLPTSPAAPIIVFPLPSMLSVLQFLGTIRCPEKPRAAHRVFLITSAGTSDLTGKACTPNNVHWTYDTWALANGTAKAVIQQDGKSWFFLTADYAFGHALERDAAGVVKANGGEVLGHVLAPFQTHDFSSFLVQARASGAQVVALANSG